MQYYQQFNRFAAPLWFGASPSWNCRETPAVVSDTQDGIQVLLGPPDPKNGRQDGNGSDIDQHIAVGSIGNR